MRQADPLVGTAYRAIRCLGSGGVGEVWDAEHRALGKRVAVKLLHMRHACDASLVERLRLEAQTQARLQHPHLVEVHDFDVTCDGRPFFVMPLLQGRALNDEIKAYGMLLVRDARRIMLQLLDVLDALHRHGLLHRDIKPSNIYLCDGKPRCVKLFDLGVVKVRRGGRVVEPLSAPTEAGLALGTPRYMSPEQARCDAVDARTDLYGAGMVLYTMLAGRGPFDHHRSLGDMLYAQVLEQPEPPSRYAAQPIDAALDAIVLQAIAKAPEARFQTAADFSDALRALRVQDLSAAGLESMPLPLLPQALVSVSDPLWGPGGSGTMRMDDSDGEAITQALPARGVGR